MSLLISSKSTSKGKIVKSIVARVVIGIVALSPCLIPLDGARQEVPVFPEPGAGPFDL